MKLALHGITYTGSFYEGGSLTIEQVIARAKQFGYNAVEVFAARPVCSPFDFDTNQAEKLRRYAEAQGIEFCTVAGYIDLPRTTPLDREKELVFARETFRLARDLGAPAVRVYAGGEHMHPGASAWQQWDWCVEAIKELVPLAETYDIDMALEWHTGVVQSTDALLDMVEQVREAQVLVARWPREYNTVRPHSALNYRPPAPEAIQPWPPDSATPRLPAMAIQTVGLT